MKRKNHGALALLLLTGLLCTALLGGCGAPAASVPESAPPASSQPAEETPSPAPETPETQTDELVYLEPMISRNEWLGEKLWYGDILLYEEFPALETLLPTGGDYRFGGIPLTEITPEELWAWAPAQPGRADVSVREQGEVWQLYDEYQGFAVTLRWDTHDDLYAGESIELGGGLSWDPEWIQGPEAEVDFTLPACLHPGDSLTDSLEALGLPKERVAEYSRAQELNLYVFEDRVELQANLTPPELWQFVTVYDLDNRDDFTGRAQFKYKNHQLASVKAYRDMQFYPGE